MVRAAARLILAAAALAAAAPAAGAAPLSLQVVNGHGVEQASLVTLTGAACPGGCTAITDGYGRLALDVAAGDRIAATRGSLAPEGAGVQYVVPAALPTTPVTITLPSVLDAVSPALDAPERWLLDRVNEQRAALGRGPLQESGTLNRAADAYARYLLSSGQFSHTALADPVVRAVDQGWPSVGGVGETLAVAPSRESALALWRSSPPHWDLLMLDGLTAAGVGRAGDRWVMSPGICPATAPERCELGASGERAAPAPAAGGGRRRGGRRGPRAGRSAGAAAGPAPARRTQAARLGAGGAGPRPGARRRAPGPAPGADPRSTRGRRSTARSRGCRAGAAGAWRSASRGHRAGRAGALPVRTVRVR